MVIDGSSCLYIHARWHSLPRNQNLSRTKLRNHIVEALDPGPCARPLHVVYVKQP